MTREQSIRGLVRQYLGLDSSAVIRVEAVSGGDIHQSFAAHYSNTKHVNTSFFIKSNDIRHAQVLRSEYHSLLEMAKLPTLHYPIPLSFECDDSAAYLLMEYHQIGPLPQAAAAELGVMLATQHQICQEKFGWPQSNFIGLTPQANIANESWARFYQDSRLQPQLDQAITLGLKKTLAIKLEKICQGLPRLIGEHPVTPALLHGDLWGGNCGWDRQQRRPILFDPAPYYGDHEADLAMTELFGGFDTAFYRAYRTCLSVDSGYIRRKPVYNLYHALNHFNLFGSSYLGMVQQLVHQVELAT